MAEKYDSTESTMEHINRVRHFINKCIDDLERRKSFHDYSKLQSPEKEYFDEYTPRLANLEYGTPEYKENMKDLKPAIDHHYANNDHHPQFHGEEGINGMNLLSLIEMICDWRAASERGKNGDIRKSLEMNAERLGISKQLKKILYNTIEYMKL